MAIQKKAKISSVSKLARLRYKRIGDRDVLPIKVTKIRGRDTQGAKFKDGGLVFEQSGQISSYKNIE